MRVFLSLAIAVALASPATAQDSDHERIRSLPLDEAIREIERIEGRSLPELNTGFMNYVVRLSLANLGYAIDLRSPEAPLTDPDTMSAVRIFEERAGLNADGVMTWGESEVLGRMAALSQLTRLSFGGSLYVSPTAMGGQVFANGSWSMPDIAYPLNYSQISCVFSEGVCEEQVLWVSSPSATGSNADFRTYVIATHTDFYAIDRWENGVLDATASSSTCRQTRLSINTRTQLVTSSTQDLDPAGCPLRGSEQRFPRIEGLRVATLVSSLDAEEAHFAGIRRAVDEVRGPVAERLFGSVQTSANAE